jgi:predicted nucleotidyltransferase
VSSAMALEHQVMVRLPADVFEAIKQLSEKEDRTISYVIRRAVKRDVQRLGQGDFGGGVNRDAVRAMVSQKKEREVEPRFKKGAKK